MTSARPAVVFQSTRPRRARQPRLRREAQQNTVSIHAPTKSATGASSADSIARNCFNPRAHEERDVRAFSMPRSHAAFQSTRPRRARPSVRWLRRRRLQCFNPRAHEERDRRRHRRRRHAERRFNPRAHEERDVVRCAAVGVRSKVSIHAPTKSATWADGNTGWTTMGFNAHTDGLDHLDQSTLITKPSLISTISQRSIPL